MNRRDYRDGTGKRWLTLPLACALVCLDVDAFLREVMIRPRRFPRRDVRLGDGRLEFRRSAIERWFRGKTV